MALNASLAALQDICCIRGYMALKFCLLWVSDSSEVMAYNRYFNAIVLPLETLNFSFLNTGHDSRSLFVDHWNLLALSIIMKTCFCVCFSRTIHEAHKHTITVGGLRIHALLQSTFEVRAINLRLWWARLWTETLKIYTNRNSQVILFLCDVTGRTDQPCLPCLAELHQVCQWSRYGGTKGIYTYLITIHVEPDCLLQYVSGKWSFGFDLTVLVLSAKTG